jgi:hypothetical protein
MRRIVLMLRTAIFATSKRIIASPHSFVRKNSLGPLECSTYLRLTIYIEARLIKLHQIILMAYLHRFHYLVLLPLAYRRWHISFESCADLTMLIVLEFLNCSRCLVLHFEVVRQGLLLCF